MNKNNETIEHAWLAYQKQLLHFIRSRVASVEDAEDILNEVFAKLLQQKSTPERIAPWLYKVTRNKIIDYYRTRKSHEILADEFSLDNEEDSVIAQLSECIIPIIQTLPNNYQQPLMLSEIEGKKNREVAEELGLSLSAVKSRILRGREKLHKSLIQCCPVYRNDAGKVIDYRPAKPESCDDNCS